MATAIEDLWVEDPEELRRLEEFSRTPWRDTSNDAARPGLGRGRGRAPSNGNWRASGGGGGDTTFYNRQSAGGNRWGEANSNNDNFGQSRGGYNNGGNNNDYSTITISSRDVGKVIGKGGSKIREIESESGARVKIKKNDDYFDEETEVELIGAEGARDKAKEIIEALLEPEAPRSATSFENRGPVDWAALLKRSDEERAARWASLPPIKKDFYLEDPEVACMPPHKVAAYRLELHNITVSPFEEDDTRSIPNPVLTFEQAFQHYPEVLDEIYKNKFEKPSPIQSQAWPILLQGMDLIGIAQTGTGKTLAFLLPAMIHIDSQLTPRAERTGPSCLVLAPTRELAQQIEREAKKYNYRNIKCVCVYGGGSRREQITTVRAGVEIVIATPGRLNDLVMAKVIDLRYVTYLILDEADRMLDMGFEPQIKKVLLDIRPDRQTVMTSATWPEGVRRLAKQYMSKPFQVFVGSLDLAAVHSVTQTIVMVEEEEKRQKLAEFVDSMGPEDKAIIFADKKAMVDHIASDFCLLGIECQSIHGDREQCDREQALEDLRTGVVRILVATDVAARGLDIKDVTHIFNYDFPRNVEEYVHRVGRTGRAGARGESITLVTRNNWRQARELISILEEAQQPVPDELRRMAERFDAWKKQHQDEAPWRGGRGGGRRW